MVSKLSDELREMGFVVAGWIRFSEKDLISAHIEDEFAKLSECLYVYQISDEVVRVGKRARNLRSRIREYPRDINKRLRGQESPTKQDEAIGWKVKLCSSGGEGLIWAKQGTVVTTQIGTFNAYTSEEEALIKKYKPPLNNRQS